MKGAKKRWNGIDWKSVKYKTLYAKRSVASSAKNWVSTDLENEVRAVTADTRQFPSNSQLYKIAMASYRRNEYIIIMEVLWPRLNSKRWRCCSKGLELLRHLILFGVSNVVDDTRNALYHFETLTNYVCIDPRTKEDKGQPVREKAKVVLQLLKDQPFLHEERTKAIALKEKMGFTGITGGKAGISSTDHGFHCEDASGSQDYKAFRTASSFNESQEFDQVAQSDEDFHETIDSSHLDESQGDILGVSFPDTEDGNPFQQQQQQPQNQQTDLALMLLQDLDIMDDQSGQKSNHPVFFEDTPLPLALTSDDQQFHHTLVLEGPTSDFSSAPLGNNPFLQFSSIGHGSEFVGISETKLVLPADNNSLNYNTNSSSAVLKRDSSSIGAVMKASDLAFENLVNVRTFDAGSSGWTVSQDKTKKTMAQMTAEKTTKPSSFMPGDELSFQQHNTNLQNSTGFSFEDFKGEYSAPTVSENGLVQDTPFENFDDNHDFGFHDDFTGTHIDSGNQTASDNVFEEFAFGNLNGETATLGATNSNAKSGVNFDFF